MNQSGEILSSGVFTNWDLNGCFVFLEKPVKIKGAVKARITFEGHTFTQQGSVTARTQNNDGIGLIFVPEPQEELTLNWKEFFEILTNRGYRAELLV